MTFWRISNGFSAISAIDKILDKPDHSLEELLNEPELLQELMAPNTRLVEYLRAPEVMAQMVGYLVDPALGADSSGSKKGGDEPAKDEEGAGDLSVSSDEEMPLATPPEQPAETFEEIKERILKGESCHNDDRDDSYNAGDLSHGYEEDETEVKQRYAQICAEILSADVWSLTEALMQSEELIDEIWKLLDFDEPLDSTYSSFFTKINQHLLDKKTDEMLAFIRHKMTLVDRFMKHIDNPPLMDFLLKIISSDKCENSTGIIDFLQQQRLIPSLISFLGPEVPSGVQSAAGDFLKAFVAISANSNAENNTIGPNELSRELVSEPCVRELVKLMLHGGTGLATGVGIVIEIIRKNNSDYDYVPVTFTTIKSHPPGPRDPVYLGTLLKLFAEHIPQFQAMLTKEHAETLETPIGTIQRLGFERFKICELIAELLHCSNMALLNDVNGEEIVRERDEERERVKKLIARARLSYGEDSDDSRDEWRLDDSEKPKEDEDPSSSMDISQDITQEEPSKTEEAQKSGDSDSEMAEPTPATKEGDPTTPNKTLENGLEDLDLQRDKANSDEAEAIRTNPVVGDQLKIALADSDCIPTIFRMFFEFPWNNFLHNVVFDIVQQVLNGPMRSGYNRYIAIDLFSRAKICEAICKTHDYCEEYEKEHKTRLGYMGYLTLISEEIVKFTDAHPPESVSPLVVEAVNSPEWTRYVQETLFKTREMYNTVLGGVRPEDSNERPNHHSILLPDKEDDDADDLINDHNLGKDCDEYGDDDDEETGYDKLAASAGHSFGEENKRHHDDDEDDDDDRPDIETRRNKTYEISWDDDDDHGLMTNSSYL
ncbi:SIT4-associating protein Sap190p [Trichomonascus vanleenenianus]|uniref:SAPS family protein n=1 Tax=Trichomonascus vanleenenianus TaxID=2268995 RepID=UPI003EC9EA85